MVNMAQATASFAHIFSTLAPCAAALYFITLSAKDAPLKQANALLEQTGTTIFTIMSALAQAHGAINLGQGFPDTDGPADVVRAAADALLDQRNQYAPLTGLPELRTAVAAANKRFYGLDIDANAGVVVTSGATEGITACLMALLNPGDEVVLIEPLYDTYLPVVTLLGATAKLVRLNPPDWALPMALRINSRSALRCRRPRRGGVHAPAWQRL